MATMEEEVDVVVEVEVEGEIILFQIFDKLSFNCFVECHFHNLFRGCGSYGCGGGGCGSCGRKKKREALEKLIDTYQNAENSNEE